MPFLIRPVMVFLITEIIDPESLIRKTTTAWMRAGGEENDCPDPSLCASCRYRALEDTDMDPKAMKRARATKLISPVKRFFYYYRSLEVNVYAAYAAYFILLSVFPAIMLLIAILQYTSISASELETMIKGVVPDSLGGVVEYMVRELFATNSVAVLSVSAVTALWMSSKASTACIAA